MFTDGPATPIRLEVLLDVLLYYPKGIDRKTIYGLLQPSSLSEGNYQKVKDTIGASLQLGLTEEQYSTIKISDIYDSNKSIKHNILTCFDTKVLSNTDIEYFFALFFAYYLGLNKKSYKILWSSRIDWSNEFNKDVFNNEHQLNRFNDTKHTGMDRWLSYVGLGWYDQSGQFQANPYDRILRSLDQIFGKESKLSGDEFIYNIGRNCPELDSGKLFLQANN
ncbi:hypothetical protein K8I28_06120, partial [bacterium]|nr:hypothetical protein [bacterium]